MYFYNLARFINISKKEKEKLLLSDSDCFKMVIRTLMKILSINFPSFLGKSSNVTLVPMNFKIFIAAKKNIWNHDSIVFSHEVKRKSDRQFFCNRIYRTKAKCSHRILKIQVYF